MPGTFVALTLDADYRSDTRRVGRDLVGCLLRGASAYDRAVGFYASSALKTLAPDIKAFFAGGGQMRLVCSPRLDGRDLEMLSRAVYQRQEVRSWWPGLDEAFASEKWPGVLAYLIATDRIRVRIALLASGDSSRMYHEKIGVFRDEEGRLVAISGSANESAGGLSENFERVDVFASWTSDTDKRRAWRVEQQFRDTWSNKTDGLEVVELAHAFQRNLLSVNSGGDSPEATPNPADAPKGITRYPEALIAPADLVLRPHQTAAIQAWADAGGKGILEMATGSGKTLTALSIAAKVSDRIGFGFALVIVAPLVHLVDQWIGIAKSFGLAPVRCADSSAKWIAEFDTAAAALNSGGRPVLSVVTTGDTLCSEKFQSILRRIRKPLLLIADEVHNYGTTERLRALPARAELRLGLSATPVRWRDEEGTKELENYFGPAVYKYSLGNAISDGILTSYRYFPTLTALSSEELDEYIEISLLLAKYVHGEEGEPAGDAAKRLLIRRARVLAGARSKIPTLARLMEPLRSESHILVYCGDGSVAGPVPEETSRQVDEVVRMLGVGLKMRCAPYIADTKATDRQRLLRDFEVRGPPSPCRNQVLG